ncbi:hypothetical protein DPEC_G00051220 [Dallia pectoralis]|uniref:Uncharacterized protein n=1 Tax=Dallia pectoralis TaxID=75939 RepID=A0ACC2HB67_DALPE|nr:hypothetical protein DPEC_G00051220 [Dallia pectoralis]
MAGQGSLNWLRAESAICVRDSGWLLIALPNRASGLILTGTQRSLKTTCFKILVPEVGLALHSGRPVVDGVLAGERSEGPTDGRPANLPDGVARACGYGSERHPGEERFEGTLLSYLETGCGCLPQVRCEPLGLGLLCQVGCGPLAWLG